MQQFDVVIAGAGAAGMMCAIEAGRRGRSVLVVDHAAAPGEKIRISGGGRCNFTNTNTAPDRFISANPRFAISALRRYTPQRIIDRVRGRGIAFHEKTLGQLFCDGPATQITFMLTGDMATAGVRLELNTTIDDVSRDESGFRIRLSSGEVVAQSFVIATGGKSVPKMGATPFGYRLAEQFGLAVTETRPGLVPLTFEPNQRARFAELAGVSLDVAASAGGKRFEEALLFTHRGLSGPAILQVSNYWREGDEIEIDLLPGRDALALLQAARKTMARSHLAAVLAEHLPRRVAQLRAEDIGLTTQLGDASDKLLKPAAEALSRWRLKPTGSEGYRTAEVTIGGVDTAGLDSTTMMARAVPGLFVIGEVVDVTGWLGGYNFQWAWASGWAAGQVA